MGYHTDFIGSIKVEPPLPAETVERLHGFAKTRHCVHRGSATEVDQEMQCPAPPGVSCSDVYPGSPSFWCNWEANEDGTFISWNEMEKFYNAEHWMIWIIKNIIPEGHNLNGSIEAYGQDPRDQWRLVVRDNAVFRQNSSRRWGRETPVV